MNSKFCSISKPIVSLISQIENPKSLETECLFGEPCKVLSYSGKWAFCQLLKDDYIGWIPKSALGLEIKTTHKVNVRNTIIFNKPNVKANPFAYISFGSEVQVISINELWAQIYFSKGSRYLTKYIPKDHIVHINQVETDWVKTAEKFLLTPYKWGGKSFLGIDCSALIQIAILSKFPKAFRNSSQQEKHIGEKIYNYKKRIELDNLQRGDLIFWKRHVGIMINKKEIIHANAYHVCVQKEKLKNTIKRMESNGFKIRNVNRI